MENGFLSVGRSLMGLSDFFLWCKTLFHGFLSAHLCIDALMQEVQPSPRSRKRDLLLLLSKLCPIFSGPIFTASRHPEKIEHFLPFCLIEKSNET